jgi:hypothetical protein
MRRATTALLGALALGFALASSAPAVAGAEEPTGNATLALSSAKARVLAERGVAFEGIRGAETTGRQTRLQISGGTIGAGTADLSHEGALLLAVGKGRTLRAVKLSALQIQLSANSTLSARLNGGKRRTIFDLRPQASGLAIDASKGLARLHGAKLILRHSIAKALSRRLEVRIPRGRLGKIRVSAAIVVIGGPAAPQSGPLGDEPPLPRRPASAVDVTGGSLTWHIRDSWIRYINTEGPAEALEGANAEAPIPEDSHPCPDRPAGTNPTLVYSYSFPFANGWYDPPSGTAALYYGGGVRFAYPSRGIDLTARNPEIELNGGSSRAIFRLRGAGQTPYPDRRAPLLALAATSPPSESPASTFGFPGPLRGTLTGDGQNVFAGFYPPPNDGFGCVDVSFTTGPG